MQKTLPRTISKKLELTPHTEWSQKFWDSLIPLKDKVAQHEYFRAISNEKLPLDLAKRALLEFYPLVENFPKYMGLILSKTKRCLPGHKETKMWLIQNIKVEQNHADWWHFWGNGFGLSNEELDGVVASPRMDAINNYLWHVNTSSSVEEGLAATNLAVEWATGEWTINVIEGVKAFAKSGLVEINERTMSWLSAHATYDDEHPYEAMELIKRVCVTPEQQQRALEAAKRSLEYYIMALDDCMSREVALAA